MRAGQAPCTAKTVALKTLEDLDGSSLGPASAVVGARLYNIVLDPHLEPSDALRGRVWREFAKRTMSVIEAKKIKSLLAQSAPVSSETVKLQDSSRGAISLSFAREPDAQIKDVASYYFALRMLLNCWAFCGIFLAKTRMALSASSSISVRVGFSGMMCLQGGRWRPRSGEPAALSKRLLPNVTSNDVLRR
ncbi:unnamed protein product [Effrenium voratum]|uniref:Uncharacterized protein n=1 Tax=Effrenium voratum TaxID=2562239 RepID=A0AA36JC80_9DINO|nr:unnamed protein product [Effrenium voratum]